MLHVLSDRYVPIKNYMYTVYMHAVVETGFPLLVDLVISNNLLKYYNLFTNK